MKLNTEQSKIRAGKLQLGDQIIINGDAWEVLHVQKTRNGEHICARIQHADFMRMWPMGCAAADADQLVDVIVFGFAAESAQADMFGGAV